MRGWLRVCQALWSMKWLSIGVCNIIPRTCDSPLLFRKEILQTWCKLFPIWSFVPYKMAVVVHAYNSSTQEGWGERIGSSKSSLITEWAQGWPGIQNPNFTKEQNKVVTAITTKPYDSGTFCMLKGHDSLGERKQIMATSVHDGSSDLSFLLFMPLENILL